MTATNSLAHCTPVYTLWKDEVGTGPYLAYTDTNINYEIVSLNNTPTNPTELLIETTSTAEGSMPGKKWRIRISVCSVADITTANNPAHIYFELVFDY